MNDPAIVPTAAQADEGLLPVSTPPPKSPLWPSPSKKTIVGLARHTLGIVLLLITVFLWTTSSFLASVSHQLCCFWLALMVFQTIFADNTYSKPFLVTYSNSLFFAILLLGPLATIAWNDIRSLFRTLIGRGQRAKYETIADDDNQDLSTPEDRSSRSPGAPLQQQQDDLTSTPDAKGASNADKMTFRETAKLGFEFSFLWVVHLGNTVLIIELTLTVCRMLVRNS